MSVFHITAVNPQDLPILTLGELLSSETNHEFMENHIYPNGFFWKDRQEKVVPHFGQTND